MGWERPLCPPNPVHGEMLWLMDLPRALHAEVWKGRSRDLESRPHFKSEFCRLLAQELCGLGDPSEHPGVH